MECVLIRIYKKHSFLQNKQLVLVNSGSTLLG